MTPEPNSSQPDPSGSIATVETLNGANPNIPAQQGTIVANAEPEKSLPRLQAVRFYHHSTRHKRLLKCLVRC